jgi:hypothetical protein
MPVQVTLYHKATGSVANWLDIDRAICAYLEVPADDDLWVHGWYDYIGLGLAFGRSLPEIADIIKQDWPDKPWTIPQLRICHFLNEHYTTDAYRVFS